MGNIISEYRMGNIISEYRMGNIISEYRMGNIISVNFFVSAYLVVQEIQESVRIKKYSIHVKIRKNNVIEHFFIS